MQAPWSPRAGLALVTQYFIPHEDANGHYRMVLIGGYGGFLDGEGDGDLRCRPDIWVTSDGVNWNMTVEEGPFGGIAWAGALAWEPNATTVEESMDLCF